MTAKGSPRASHKSRGPGEILIYKEKRPMFDFSETLIGHCVIYTQPRQNKKILPNGDRMAMVVGEGDGWVWVGELGRPGKWRMHF